MKAEFDTVFSRLREILRKHAQSLSVKEDLPGSYSLEAEIGAATLRAWKGKARTQTIPVAWIEAGKTYVSYHLMGLYGNTKLQNGMSKELRSRMQGKTCFNFKTTDEVLLQELDRLTADAIADFRKAGYIKK